MEAAKKKLPIGVDHFEKLRKENFYYVDKTDMIRELLGTGAEVTLFTRPRRFGKSLNMSMLKSFFDIEADTTVFQGLNISKEKELCEQYMGKYPVIFTSLKEISGDSYQSAREMLIANVHTIAEKNQYLLESPKLTEIDRENYRKLLREDMSDAILLGSLLKLCSLMEKHYGQKVIVLIDEYDVPLAKAFDYGYYDQMVHLLRGFLGQVLKSNESLKFAVLTGCMRIAKESIFTGLNNLTIRSVTDVRFDEYFGFTDREVQELLTYYECEDHYQLTKEWYDGYQFGNVDVYCPWDVLNYCDALQADKEAEPQNYWMNTSSNEIVRKFIQKAEGKTTKREIERLIAGEEIQKEICQELTYQDMYADIDHIWSVLFTTGYLTQHGRPEGNEIRLAIPNLEIRNIFTTQITEYFRESVKKDGETLRMFCDALEQGNAAQAKQCFETYLKRTISIRDTFVQKKLKENFYHGILLGILGMRENWTVSSNRESGDGYSDIMIETENGEIGMILELKYAQDGDLDAACEQAMEQIDRTGYMEALREEEVHHVRKYAVACYLKHCKFVLKNEVIE